MGFLRQVLAFFCGYIYEFIAWVYELFINISRVELLSSDDIAPIYQRFTLILAIIMVFYITFEFVKFVVQPDGIVDKEKGAQKTVFKMILVVIMIAFVPSIFSLAYKFQNIVFDNQLFSKIILGKQDVEMSSIGKDFSANMFSMFYYFDKEKWSADEICKTDSGDIACQTIIRLNVDTLRAEGEMPYLTMGLDADGETENKVGKKKLKEFKINFNGLFALVVGIFVLYMLVLYCIDAGVRVAQLTFLQIIAPIPIIGYLSPKKEGLFQKWIRQCITTYLDLFLRVGIIYFVLLLAQIITKALTDGTILEHATTQNDTMKTFMFVAIIMGLLLFAKKAPELIKELFPSTSAASGNFGLKAGDRVAPLAARAIGGTLGATRAVTGAIARAHNRHIRNKANGQKSWLTKEGRQQIRDRRENRRAAKAAGKDTKQAEGRATTAGEAKKRADLIESKRDALREKARERDAAKSDVVKARAELDKAKTPEERRAAEAKVKAAEARLNASQKELKAAAQKTASDIHQIRMQDSGYRERYEAKQKTMSNWTSEADNLRRANAAYDEAVKKGASKEELERLDEARKSARDAWAEKVDEGLHKTDEDGKTGKEKITEAMDYSKKIADVAAASAAAQTAQDQLAAAQAAEQKARDQVVEDQNTRYRSVAAAGAWGALAGATTGAYHGAQATKWEDIGAKVVEGHKKDIENLHAVDKYYDEGGTSAVNRVATTIAKKVIGMDTGYTETRLRTEADAKEIKKHDETISRAEGAKKSFDATESRLKEKIGSGEAKFIVPEDSEIDTGVYETNPDGTRKLDENGKPIPKKIKIAKGQAIISVVENERTKAQKMRVSAEDAIKAKEAHEREHAAILSQSREKLSGEQLEQYDEAVAKQESLSRTADAASEAAAEQEKIASLIDKHAARYMFTQMLQGKPGDYDATAMEYLADQRESIKIASQDIEIRDRLSSMVRSGSLALEDYNAFMTGNFASYDQLDHVISAITNAKNDIARTRQIISDRKTRAESSATTAAQKADNDYKGGN